ncbi:indole-3-glycerol phosphate synthase [Corynebacterium kutscheri]|uniref:Multifunctional fusion protein n=1 Tax=Corynebacterium kutscheri TaxID=35755 RepID=A0A0F6TE48_9CORY|nr:bifunctional indole-3-glycerol-phosphate synthase TrpC/phosphoribosylanthranilate isomerase TrpF [Corynebacterium kutscheri]AKE42266.1 indole-3-glycerol phosphate synthase [Corynebacterium kutscheri]VEH05646.1 indole-3-glycerol phosphate synthase [Corynebacterium kutscheri]VEH10610.1 indole-3-glycerol phosphate synthase [Corynebacterium kutscheri]VEH81540.1 indole-3-glycerol phosphate synthase [Corynebacterium kutscheri]
MHKLPTVLEEIVSSRRQHLAEIQQRIAHVDRAQLPASTRSLYQNLRANNKPHFIMECKSASPSLGLIRKHYQPGDIARIYSQYAAGISVLCEPERFGGDYDHLATVASSTHLPVLCKDFIIDDIQIYAARYFGADAILLMLSVLDDATYTRLATLAHSLGLDILTEVINKKEVERAIALGATIVGINHRNLHDLSIDLSRSGELAQLLPKETVVIAESGIRDNATVRALSGYVDGFLVGSQLTSQPDIDRAVRKLIYGTTKICGLTSDSAAQVARAVGAIYGGLIFEEASPRNVSRETSQKIIAAEPGLDYVAVSRRTKNWHELIQPGIVAIQVHAPYQGSLEKEQALITQVRSEVDTEVELWRALSFDSFHDPAIIASSLLDSVDKLVLDNGAGGTGKSFNWSHIPADLAPHILLAGGIGIDNIDAALAIGAAGVDINSGVEYPNQPGYKDAGAIHRLFSHIRRFHK